MKWICKFWNRRAHSLNASDYLEAYQRIADYQISLTIQGTKFTYSSADSQNLTNDWKRVGDYIYTSAKSVSDEVKSEHSKLSQRIDRVQHDFRAR